MTIPVGGKGPERIPEGQAREWLARNEPIIVVSMDVGVFDWLWRIVEAKAEHHCNDPWLKTAVPEQVDVAVRAVLAFREAAGTLVPPKKRRRLVRIPNNRV